MIASILIFFLLGWLIVMAIGFTWISFMTVREFHRGEVRTKELLTRIKEETNGRKHR